MKPVDSRVIGALRFGGLCLGAVVAIAAIYQYMRFTGRPDASEVRDFWLVVALELAAVPLLLSLLVPYYDVSEPLALESTPAPRMPNPWTS